MKDKASKFAAQMSHDIKNPLGNALMYTDLLISDLKTSSSADAAQFEYLAKNIKISLNSLIVQIDTWATAIKLKDGLYDPDLKETDLGSLLSSLLDEQAVYLKRKKINSEVKIPSGDCLIKTDAFLLKHMLENLFSMMLMYASPEDTMRFSVEKSDLECVLILEDTYKGDRENILKKLHTGVVYAVDDVLEEGILKPAGYGMMFCNEAAKTLALKPHINKSELGGLSIKLHFPLA